MQARTTLHRIHSPPTSLLQSLKSFSNTPLPPLNSYHYTHLLKSCTNPQNLTLIHAQIITAGHHRNPFLTTNLISSYTALGGPSIHHARQLFDHSPQRDTFLWNIMIRAYATSGPPTDALAIYSHMKQQTSIPSNCYTYTFVLKACAALADHRTGRAVHAHTVRFELHNTIFVGNALVAFYCKCSEMKAAYTVFDSMPVKDIVSWNSLIAGCVRNSRAAEAIATLHQMLHAAVTPDRATLVSILPACTALAGMWAHSCIIKTGMAVDTVLGSGLIGMYGHCGRLDTACAVFGTMAERDTVMCNAMIGAYAGHGQAREALEIMMEMLEEGMHPDSICFLDVMSACSHAGMVDEGLRVFDMMDGCGVEKREIHYACVVDMLGRAGKLKEAMNFIQTMPFVPGRDVWGALLGACKIYNNVDLAEVAAERLFVLDSENAGRYSALAKIYEYVGRREDAAGVRKAMKDRGVRKLLGYSMIDVDGEACMFGVESEVDPMADEIYAVLELLHQAAEEEGLVTHDPVRDEVIPELPPDTRNEPSSDQAQSSSSEASNETSSQDIPYHEGDTASSDSDSDPSDDEMEDSTLKAPQVIP